MARGQTNLAKTLETGGATQLSNAQSLYGNVNSNLQKIVNNPGYTPQQINTQTNAAEAPIAAQTAAGRTALEQRGAASRNTAGLVAGEDKLSRTAAQLGSQASWGVQSAADKEALTQKMQALSEQGSLYGQTLNSANSLYGTAKDLLGQKSSFNVKAGPVGFGGGG